MSFRGARSRLLLLSVLFIAGAASAFAQSERPLPHPLQTPPLYARAVDVGSRTPIGVPGTAYWQNYATYKINAVLSPSSEILRADGKIRYFNNSPDLLNRVYLHLRQNLHAPDAIRNRTVSVTDGVKLTSVRAGGRPLVERPSVAQPGFHVNGTVLRVELPEALAPGDSVDLHLAWNFQVPRSAPRMGQDGEVYFLAFWYPQMAVYDDVIGWNIDQYQGRGEFYMGFGDYDVRITVPEQWLVAATGTIQNADSIFSEKTYARLNTVTEASADVDSVVHVVTEADRGNALRESSAGTHTWHFTAERVRDFAFGTSAHYVWDATVAEVPGRAPVPIHSFYRPHTNAWNRSAEFTRWSVEWLSERISPYPFAHMSVVEGLISGGMEYPMLTLIGGTRTPPTLFRTVFHEVAHIWYPMLVSQNEKAFAWMDEGLVSFLSIDALGAFWGEAEANFYNQYYTRVAGTGMEIESARHTDQYPLAGSARTSALYGKPTVAMTALRGMVGADAIGEALRVYTERWAYRHPYPTDLFRTFNDVLGRDLDWFWSAYFFETWTLDHVLQAVESDADEVRVIVRDAGLLPSEAVVELTYADGSTERRSVDPRHWLSGETSATLTFPPGEVQEATLDPDRTNPDMDRENDAWSAG